jgi:hypothetical protein
MSAAVCPDSGQLAARIATDASVLGELLAELIGDGAEASNTLHCAMAVVSRMGMSADLIARANGAEAIHRDPAAWFVNEGGQAAIEALRAKVAP